MLFTCLAIGFLFGTSAAALTFINGGGILLAILAYGAGGALAILAMVAYLVLAHSEQGETELTEPASA